MWFSNPTLASFILSLPETTVMTKDPIPKELFDILCCPTDKADLKYDHDKTHLVCTKCSYPYPIKEGIPVLLPPDLQDN
jgi:uncharacterized protein YbaR (Trm112 family)